MKYLFSLVLLTSLTLNAASLSLDLGSSNTNKFLAVTVDWDNLESDSQLEGYNFYSLGFFQSRSDVLVQGFDGQVKSNSISMLLGNVFGDGQLMTYDVGFENEDVSSKKTIQFGLLYSKKDKDIEAYYLYAFKYKLKGDLRYHTLGVANNSDVDANLVQASAKLSAIFYLTNGIDIGAGYKHYVYSRNLDDFASDLSNSVLGVPAELFASSVYSMPKSIATISLGYEATEKIYLTGAYDLVQPAIILNDSYNTVSISLSYDWLENLNISAGIDRTNYSSSSQNSVNIGLSYDF